MEIMGLILGVFGLIAYLELSSLKGRTAALEEQLAKLKGTSFHEDRKTLVQAARSYIGQAVHLELKEDHQDADISLYGMDISLFGNVRYGSNTILDADEEWMLVHVEPPKSGTAGKDKLIRMASIRRISLVRE